MYFRLSHPMYGGIVEAPKVLILHLLASLRYDVVGVSILPKGFGAPFAEGEYKKSSRK